MNELITSVADNRVFTYCVPDCSLELLGGIICSSFMSTVCSIIIVVSVVFATMIATGEISVDVFANYLGVRQVQRQDAVYIFNAAAAVHVAQQLIKPAAQQIEIDKTALNTYEFHPVSPMGGMIKAPGRVTTPLGVSDLETDDFVVVSGIIEVG